MKICNLTGSQYQEFLEFNREIYPDRKDVEERFRLQVLDNPFVEDASTSNVLLAYNTEGKMVGQFIIYPCEYHFGGKLLRCFFGSDLFVLEEYRHKGMGRFLTSRAINDFKPHFSIDISETAKKIFLALKAQIIGNMQKYLWLSRTTAALRCIFRAAWRHEHVQFRDYEFPRKLSGEGYTFNLVRFLENWENPNWHEN
jgi:GNAT superfamily N-acetyltransferase